MSQILGEGILRGTSLEGVGLTLHITFETKRDGFVRAARGLNGVACRVIIEPIEKSLDSDKKII